MTKLLSVVTIGPVYLYKENLMKKYCPFCESELSASLWCEHCKRQVILYNTHSSAAVRNADEHHESGDPTTRSSLVSDDIATVNNTFSTDNIADENSSTDEKVNAVKKASSSDNVSPAGQKPKRDTPKLVLLGSMLLVCLILCFIV